MDKSIDGVVGIRTWNGVDESAGLWRPLKIIFSVILWQDDFLPFPTLNPTAEVESFYFFGQIKTHKGS